MIVRSASVSPWLVILRIYVGFFWLIHGLPKFLAPDQFMPPNGFMAMLVQRSAGQTTGPYHDFLVNTVIPNMGLFAQLDRFGEVLAGISLLLGLITPLGAIVGCFLALNYMGAHGEFTKISGYTTLDAVAFVLSFLVLVLGLGRVASCDSLLFRRRTRALTPEFVAEPPPGPHAPTD